MKLKRLLMRPLEQNVEAAHKMSSKILNSKQPADKTAIRFNKAAPSELLQAIR